MKKKVTRKKAIEPTARRRPGPVYHAERELCEAVREECERYFEENFGAEVVVEVVPQYGAGEPSSRSRRHGFTNADELSLARRDDAPGRWERRAELAAQNLRDKAQKELLDLRLWCAAHEAPRDSPVCRHSQPRCPCPTCGGAEPCRICEPLPAHPIGVALAKAWRTLNDAVGTDLDQHETRRAWLGDLGEECGSGRGHPYLRRLRPGGIDALNEKDLAVLGLLAGFWPATSRQDSTPLTPGQGLTVAKVIDRERNAWRTILRSRTK